MVTVRVVKSALLTALLLAAWVPGPVDARSGAERGFGVAAEEIIEVDLHKLTSLAWEPGDPVPDEIKRLHGKRVVLRGFMHASVQGDQRKFPMVTEACQCTSTLLPHHFVEVDLGPNARTGPKTGQFEVIGRLEIGEVEEDGYVTSLYRLKGRFY